jgi:type II secretory pathway pseudopilin PulG
MRVLISKLRNLASTYDKTRAGKGLTLVELLIVSLVLAVTIGALLVVFVNALNQIVLSKELSIATDDLRDTLEKIKATPFTNIVVQYPNGSPIAASVIGGFILPNESISISYPRGTNADPLEVTATITWLSKDKRTRTQSFNTLLTRMM